MSSQASPTLLVPPRTEWAQPGDEYYTYCLWPYDPIAPTAGKLASAMLYYASLGLASAGPAGLEVVDRLRSCLGPFRTVYGVKLQDGRWGWELYLYDYARRQRTRSLPLALAALEPLLTSPVPNVEHLPYFMFSLDLGPLLLEGRTALEHVNLYLGNIGSTVSSGVSYKLTSEARTQENFYFFFRPSEGFENIIGKAQCSAYIDDPDLDLAEIIWPELADCDTICYANKKTNDCIYFSGVNVHQLLYFLRRLHYPAELIAYVEANVPLLDHLWFDVGYDFTYGRDGLRFVKSGYYGIF